MTHINVKFVTKVLFLEKHISVEFVTKVLFLEKHINVKFVTKNFFILTKSKQLSVYFFSCVRNIGLMRA